MADASAGFSCATAGVAGFGMAGLDAPGFAGVAGFATADFCVASLGDAGLLAGEVAMAVAGAFTGGFAGFTAGAGFVPVAAGFGAAAVCFVETTAVLTAGFACAAARPAARRANATVIESLAVDFAILVITTA